MKKAKKRKTAVRARPCPSCGSLEVVAIYYGEPTREAMQEAEKGLIALGGCCVFEDDPRKHCNACGEDFDRPSPRRTRPAQ